MSLPGPPPLNDSSGNHALIVAIETYRTKRDHSLDGPAHDAIGWLRWFREDCRVPSGNLLVLTSPLECNKGLFADLGVECRLDPDLGNEAVKDALRRFQGKAGRLWLIWSGHGIVRERERFAFLANYREDDRNVLSIETLQDHLKTTALRYPRDQVLVFDTCGTVFDEYKFQQTLAYQMFGKGEVDKSCRQFLMFASEDGTVAVNRQGVGGTFTAELLASLKFLNPDKPADLREVHERMLLRFEDLRLRDPKVQRPILYTWRTPDGDGQENIALVPDRAWRPEFVFELERAGDRITLKGPADRTREVDPPWRMDHRFGMALRGFNTLTRQTIESDSDRAELFGHANALGDALFGLPFDEAGVARLREAMIPNGPRPLVVIRSGDDTLLSLPWELLRLDGAFLVRDRRIDLVRCTSGQVGTEELPREPSGPFKLVVNVSAPEGSKLSYEAESYRITNALTELCPLVPTELGTLADLVETVARERPTGIHFSGHGVPRRLAFEDDEGGEHLVTVDELLQPLREQVSDGKLPPFFYLASCHGNTPGEPEKGTPGSESLAARLHREGVIQVVGYYGPIVDILSTRAEEALYEAIAEGHPTSFAVRRARATLAQPLEIPDPVLRDVPLVAPAADSARDPYPFAWAQLVLYQRGPDHPLSRPAPPGWRRRPENVLHRTFQDVGTRRILATGFIGRRTDLHRLRQRIRRGDRVFVLQGLGGMGKSTLAFHMLPLLEPSKEAHCILWCQDAVNHTEGADPIAEALVGQLSAFGRQHLGLDWERVASGRVDLGGRPPRPPTDPGLHITRTRFLIS